MPRSVFLLLLIAPCAFANSAGSAIQALRTAAALPGAKSGAIVELAGKRGEPFPSQWTILLADPTARGGVREVSIAAGSITGERTPLKGHEKIAEMPAIDPAKVTMDADSLFHATQAEAVAARTGFHSMDYHLATNPTTFQPEWTATLHDSSGITVGRAIFSARTGAVIKPLELEGDSSPSRKKIGGLVGRISDSAGSAARKIKNTTLRAVGDVQEFLVGERTVVPDDTP